MLKVKIITMKEMYNNTHEYAWWSVSPLTPSLYRNLCARNLLNFVHSSISPVLPLERIWFQYKMQKNIYSTFNANAAWKRSGHHIQSNRRKMRLYKMVLCKGIARFAASSIMPHDMIPVRGRVTVVIQKLHHVKSNLLLYNLCMEIK